MLQHYLTDNEISNLSQFVQTELQYLEPEIYKIEYPELTYSRVIPVSQATSGAQQVAYDIYDRNGESELITSTTKDIPAASAGKLRKYRGIYGYGIAAKYTLQELRASQMARLPLETRQLEAARYGNEIKMNKIAYFGDPVVPETDFYGLFNNGETGVFVNGVDTGLGVPEVTDQEVSPTAVTWQAAIVAAGTDQQKLVNVTQQILEQINFMFASVNNKSIGVEVADTLLLPRAQYNLIAITVISSFTQETLLSRLIKNSPYLRDGGDIIVVNELSLVNAIVAASGNASPFGTTTTRVPFTDGGTTPTTANLQQDCMFAYRKDPHRLKFWTATPFQFLSPQLNAFEFRLNGYTTTAGTLVYYPLSTAAFFGI